MVNARASAALASQPVGTIYYVDSVSGNDAWSGQSADTPWRTLGRVTSHKGFMPGDSVLLRRGCVWREQLRIPASGAAGAPILFSSYGTGPRPLIDGSDLVTDWTPTSVEGVWSTPVSWIPTQAFDGGHRLAQYRVKKGEAVPSLAQGQWALNQLNQTVYVRPFSASSPLNTTIEISRRKSSIEGHSHDHIVVRELAVARSAQDGLSTNSGSYWDVDGVTAYSNWGYGLKAGTDSKHVLFRDSKVWDNRVGLGGHDASHVWILSNQSAGNSAHVNGDGINISWSDHVVIDGNVLIDNSNGGSADGIQAAGCQDILIRNNYIENSSNAGVILTLSAEKSYGQIEGNVIRGGKLGVAIMTDHSTTLVHGNTIYNDHEAGIKISKVKGSPNILIFGNTVIQSATTGYTLSVSGSTPQWVGSDGNWLYTSGANYVNWGGKTYHDLETYQAETGQDGNSADKLPPAVFFLPN